MTSHSDMRQADINRVKKAKEHLKAALTLLTNIKWEHTSFNEDYFINQAKDTIRNADGHLADIINIQDTEK